MAICQTPRLSRRECAHCPWFLPANEALLAALSRAPHHAQIEDVAEWLAEMARRADWMSNGARSGKSFDIAKWKTRLEDPKDGPKEADKLAARKHRLVALFRSANCYSANVHASTHGLSKLVNSLVRLSPVRLDRLTEELLLNDDNRKDEVASNAAAAAKRLNDNAHGIEDRLTEELLLNDDDRRHGVVSNAAAAAKGLNDNAHGIDRFGYRVSCYCCLVLHPRHPCPYAVPPSHCYCC